MQELNITINGNQIKVNRGITLEELSKSYEQDYQYEIILAKVDGIYKELNETINKECTIEFFDLMDRGANRIYLNGLVYLMIVAFKSLFGQNHNIKVNHSLDKGLYIEPTIKLQQQDLDNLKIRMQELVKANLSIERITVSRLEAIEYFKRIHDITKSEIMKYITSTHLTLYKLGTEYNYFYSLMPTSTKVLSHFELTYLNEDGFVLRFPTIYMKKGIKEYEHRENVFHLFQESRSWAKQLELENVVDLNKKVSNNTIEELIQMDELMKNYGLMELAKKIVEQKDTKIVLLAGPSSTGKTTTTNKLMLSLKSLGKNPHMLSMDDFFVNRCDTPLDDEGNPDFERLETVDLKLFEETIEKLLIGQETLLPTFNFLLGEKEFKQKMKMNPDDILLIEGIHALNPLVLEHIPKEKKCTIYLSALTELNIDNHVRVSTTDNRLLRRIVRDNRTRGNKVEDTLKSWAKVREGEENYIFPYQDEADYTFNTAMIYELGVLKTFVEPLLYSVEPTSPYYNEAIRLINFLRLFLPISSESIPSDSILREFIGGGCFRI